MQFTHPSKKQQPASDFDVLNLLLEAIDKAGKPIWLKLPPHISADDERTQRLNLAISLGFVTRVLDVAFHPAGGVWLRRWPTEGGDR